MQALDSYDLYIPCCAQKGLGVSNSGDLGFRGVDAANPGAQIIHRGKLKSLSDQQRKWLKRRQAVEPVIGHLKHDNGMDRCWLLGATGDALHAVLCAAATTSAGCCARSCAWGSRAFLRRCSC